MPSSTIAELAKLLLVALFATYGMATSKHGLVLALAAFGIALEVVSSDLLVNVSPLLVIGIIYFPAGTREIRRIAKTPVGQRLLLYLLLLAGTALLFGLLSPWQDPTRFRPLNQRAEGRAIIYLGRTILELSAAFYIARVVENEPKYIYKLINYLLLASAISALGVLAEFLLQRDIFSIFAPGRAAWAYNIFDTVGRYRGLNGEPKVSGQIATLGILLLLIRPRRRVWQLSLLVLNAASFILTVSRTAMVTLLVGFVVMTAVQRKYRLSRSILAVALVASGIALLNLNIGDLGLWQKSAHNYGQTFSSAPEHASPVEKLAYALEVFDGSAVLFFNSNPEYLLTGTGPGLIGIPSSNYIPTETGRDIYVDGINTPPKTGVVRIVSDVGIIGFLIWVSMCALAFRSLKRMRRGDDHRGEWATASICFAVFTILYLFQVGEVWWLFLAQGLAASLSLRTRSRVGYMAIADAEPVTVPG